ncbi:MAG: 5-methyltetrahydropteroyltriglutamate--homocysteine S-methyltransferase [Alphaproteobacteria bacterium]|nr:5-methyltetrahydropteroyltriglutamate--homocysteine S-methyltransferase [Alphaproteobacteria bacterium]
MPQRTKPPFRADHVGSLLRPKAVRDARAAHTAGRIDAAALRCIEDQAVGDLVKMQIDAGLQSVTDGEIRRRSWHMDFLYRLGGVERDDAKVTVQFHGQSGDIPFAVEGLRIIGRIALKHTIFGEDFAYLKSVANGVVPKLTLPSPSIIHRRGGKIFVGSPYKDVDALFADVARAYADEIDRLGKLGLTYLQLDDTTFATLCDPDQRAGLTKSGADGEHMHAKYIDLVNAAIRNRPAGMAVCTHSCRGNFRSAWISAGGYDFIAEALFNTLEVDGFFLEYDDDRSGGFAPLRFLPKGKVAVLGLVTTKRGALESKDDLKRRIDQAAQYAPLEQLCLSPQCGFASTEEGNDLTEAEEAAKLRLVAETAREVWG